MRLFLLLSLIACSDPPPEPPAPAVRPAPSAALHEALEGWRYVGASRLNVRAGPSAEADRIGALELNQPVTPLREEGAFTEVELLNGKRGWVASEFLRAERLSWEQAVAEAEAAPFAAEALPHWQRAAALRPLDRGTLRSLTEAYQAAGEAELAAKVRASLARPEALWAPLQVGPGLVDLPFAYVPLTRETPGWMSEAYLAYADGDYLDPARLRAAGYPAPEAEQWWVLPAEGVAAPAEALGAGVGLGNECDATYWLMLRVRYTLPEGVEAVAVWAGEPPASWREDPGAERRPTPDEALRRAREAAAALPEPIPENAGWRSWPAGEAREVRVDWRVGPPAEEIFDSERWATRSFVVGPDAVEVGELAHYERSGGAEQSPAATRTVRDVDGDGRPDSAGDDGCQSWVGGDLWSLHTDTRCCGC